MRVAAIVLSALACVIALPLVALMFWIFGGVLLADVSGAELWSLGFLAIAGVHALNSAVSLAFATRAKTGFHVAALVMATLSLLFSASAFVIGPALLFGLSGA